MTDDMDALLAALDIEIEERHRANPYRTDDERLAALKQFIAEVRARPNTCRSTFEPLSQEDKDRARALTMILMKSASQEDRARGCAPTNAAHAQGLSDVRNLVFQDADLRVEGIDPAKAQCIADGAWMDQPTARPEPEPRVRPNLGVLFRRFGYPW